MDLLLRFVLGGVVVSLFSAIGELFEPKTFAGLFGAAPSVALTSLALTAASIGHTTIAIEARWMLIGSVALFAYTACCVVLLRRDRLPVWLSAIVAVVVWFAIALGAWGVA